MPPFAVASAAAANLGALTLILSKMVGGGGGLLTAAA